MKTAEVIEMFRSAIANTRQSGTTQVTIEDLEAYASYLEKTAAKTPNDVAVGDAVMEKYKANLSAWIGARQQHHELDLEMLRATLTMGHTTLKSALLINGGAAVALLAFIGGIWSKESSKAAISAVSESLYLYVIGVLSAALAAGASYFAQAGYGGEFWKVSRTIGRIGHTLAVLFIVAAYVFFARASWLAFIGLNSG